MKKGFTLVELLAVIAIMAIIAVISLGGIQAVRQSVNEKLDDSTISVIENAGVLYGEDNKNRLKENCDGILNCKSVSVRELMETGYLKTSKKKKENATDADVYYIGNFELTEEILNRSVFIYLESNIVYAKLAELDS